jgi:hypothetical protein
VPRSVRNRVTAKKLPLLHLTEKLSSPTKAVQERPTTRVRVPSKQEVIRARSRLVGSLRPPAERDITSCTDHVSATLKAHLKGGGCHFGAKPQAVHVGHIASLRIAAESGCEEDRK